MIPSPDELNRATQTAIEKSEELKRALEKLREHARRGRTDEFADAHQKVADGQLVLDNSLQDLASLFGMAPLSIADFLSQVGDAAVAAQRQLEAANRDSIKLAREMGLPASGVFKLPHLSGEVKFSFSEVRAKKLGLVFAVRKQEEITRNEQSLKFEIVSAPPPPEMLRAENTVRLVLDPVLRPSDRAPILQALTTSTKILGREGKPATAGKDEPARFVGKEPDGALIFPVPADDEEAAACFIVLYAVDSDKPDDTDKVGIWEVEPASETVRIIWQVESTGAPRNEDIDRLRRWIRAVVIRQKEWFGTPA